MFNIGSPNSCSTPCVSSASKPRWIAPIDAADTLPYSVVSSAACSPTCCSIARRSLRSSSRSPASSAILNVRFSTPSCVSFNCSSRASSSGPEIGHRRANRVPALAEHVPEHDGAGFVAQLDAERGGALRDLRVAAAGGGEPREIAFDVGHEHRHADSRELLRERLQRDRLARARRARDETVAIRERRQQRHLVSFRPSQREAARSYGAPRRESVTLARPRLGIYNTPLSTVAYAAARTTKPFGGIRRDGDHNDATLAKAALAHRLDRGRRRSARSRSRPSR